MNLRVVISPDADRDVEEQAVYIGHDSLQAAVRFQEAFARAIHDLTEMPLLGPVWESGRGQVQGLRMWRVPGFEKHLIFYQPIDAGITIVRVLHGARDIPYLLDLAADNS